MKTLAVVILDKFADWEPALLTAGLQSIIGGYTVRWASVDREVKTSMGGLRVEPDMIISEIPSTAVRSSSLARRARGVLCPPKIPSSSPQFCVVSRMRANRLVVSATARISWLLLACSMDAGTPPIALRTSRICLPTRTRIST